MSNLLEDIVRTLKASFFRKEKSSPLLLVREKKSNKHWVKFEEAEELVRFGLKQCVSFYEPELNKKVFTRSSRDRFFSYFPSFTIYTKWGYYIAFSHRTTPKTVTSIQAQLHNITKISPFVSGGENFHRDVLQTLEDSKYVLIVLMKS